MIKFTAIQDNGLQKNFVTHTFNFDDNVNVLFSSNGVESEKNDFFELLARSTGVDTIGTDGGWSQLKNITEDSQNRMNEKLVAHWSGKPAMYINSNRMVHNALSYYMGANQFSGITNVNLLEFLFGFNQPMYITITKILTYVKAVVEQNKIPYLTEDNKHTTNNATYNKIVSEFKKEYPDTITKPMLLLNHVDIGFDIATQKEFHKEVLPELAKTFQIIMSSYSVFALEHEHKFDLDGKLKETLSVF